MKIMVIDTALGACAAGVFAGEPGALPPAPPQPLGVRVEVMAKGHQERLGGLARDAAAEAGGFDGIERIGVTVGPGSFTGLRVGLAFALGLGAALDRPVVGISTLDALAASVPADGLVAAVIDARRGQVYARLFRDGAPLGQAEALPRETARDRIRAEAGEAAPTLVGSGAAVLAEAFPELADAILHPLPAPAVEAIAALALAADPATAPPQPLYLRAPDATPPSRLPGQPRQPAA
ncbi:tRNA (adenosine(37)-N6)-threonylcarbamoyltransferase complex dimerization subunit type 1 TsaB [Brevundimonas naejangsanensis]|uniref:tRNA (Adenosine(37)-N6)-threonylcarbamoyltransferase complex dimerization subunit type 1 TsaB n=1 Tax=Brevundimonas naejangsanensis TaxID=588932 RepID=A0A494RHQ2_9CAUL|nr:tRNA (adenosine(37)-N6)-threonylcarbamoyltransferase complex dimerization subunit type 1 TsaB [Brevundimonas naejangsanensis]AYG94633.1 tRNA (adenosine(37)-N6)-threonylcarbamoyltransferase complex dimerization subunit type 1 TsaB [Brevundimonas naejangsanensis]